MKCPDCYEEVVVGDTDCPYCGAELNGYMDIDFEDDTFVTLATISDEQEAYCLRDLLENQGITAKIERYGKKTGSFLADDDAWGEIDVASSSLNFAESIVTAYMASASKSALVEVIPPEDEDEEEDEDENYDE